MIGITIDNRFKILKQHSAGGSAVIWDAIDTITDKNVAIKAANHLN